jgi:hypothetical protein
MAGLVVVITMVLAVLVARAVSTLSIGHRKKQWIKYLQL